MKNDQNEIIKVIYEFEDGTREYLDGEDVKTFFRQVNSASMMVISHGGSFQKLDWKKENELRIS